MSKKVNITRDLESRRKIERALPHAKAISANTFESKAGTSTEAERPQSDASRDKKSGRKAERNP